MAIIKIGAFINVGAKTDGLLHISQISTEYVSSVTDRLQVGQEVEVRVLTIEPDGLKFARERSFMCWVWMWWQHLVSEGDSRSHALDG